MKRQTWQDTNNSSLSKYTQNVVIHILHTIYWSRFSRYMTALGWPCNYWLYFLNLIIICWMLYVTLSTTNYHMYRLYHIRIDQERNGTLTNHQNLKCVNV
jgi:hypothetical protein